MGARAGLRCRCCSGVCGPAGYRTAFQFVSSSTGPGGLLLFADLDIFPPGHHPELFGCGLVRRLGGTISTNIIFSPPLPVALSDFDGTRTFFKAPGYEPTGGLFSGADRGPIRDFPADFRVPESARVLAVLPDSAGSRRASEDICAAARGAVCPQPRGNAERHLYMDEGVHVVLRHSWGLVLP